ncbi:uncharacterized protein PHALS_01134 [Plasmopara halstedii]|uniref:Uncharacterized protein n=1 Tax=Plasmopara halstedii TaxID=4781 RepID=A0A0P1ATX5_PLAHL|nr:uncharacterized protein PHALS_01134 [Plasmopara halstedii]CEG44798.1 hypothetical protein PHALS_01134 [Plasmopara halstedii]|eukprot:XP_024581167.1 hypothetical protein PHALS_01134 [Plasmopara halstedii]
MPAWRISLKSRKCSRLFDHEGDWVDEPREVRISISENVVVSSRAGSTSGNTTRSKLIVERLREWHTACHGRRVQDPVGQPQPLQKTASVRQDSSAHGSVFCQVWRHFLYRRGPDMILNETR